MATAEWVGCEEGVNWGQKEGGSRGTRRVLLQCRCASPRKAVRGGAEIRTVSRRPWGSAIAQSASSPPPPGILVPNDPRALQPRRKYNFNARWQCPITARVSRILNDTRIPWGLWVKLGKWPTQSAMRVSMSFWVMMPWSHTTRLIVPI